MGLRHLIFRNMVLLFAIAIGGAATAQSPTIPKDLRTFPPYQIVRGRTDSDGFPTSNARLCIGSHAAEQCYVPSGKGSEVDTPFGLGAKAQDVTLATGANLMLFTAEFSAGGSGSLSILALLAYTRDGRMMDLLPRVTVTEQSEYQIWSIPKVSPMPVLVTADYYWSKGETHFADHLFDVDGYIFDAATNRYVRRVHYRTAKKYPSLDNVDKIAVLSAEKPEIMRKLTESKGKK